MDSATSPALSPPAFPAQGDFTAIAAPDLLIDLVRRRFSGTLRADRGGVVKVLYFGEGDLACASSNAEEDRLGNLLVRHGRLGAEQLAHAKQRQGEKASIGNTLVELGFITSAELLWGARRQVEDIVTDLLGWREGSYQIRASTLSKEIVNLQMPARTLVVRALQQLTDRELVVERLGTMEAVLSRVEPFNEAARAFDFGFAADELLSSLDGRRTVHAICESIDMEDFQACKVLYTLLCFGLLRRATPPSARELVFVEGELQEGQQMVRVPEPASRWARRKAERSEEPPAPPPIQLASPAETAPDEEVVSIVINEESGAGSPSEPSAEPAVEETTAVPNPLEGAAHRNPGRRLVLPAIAWKGLIALGLAALIGAVIYFTYFRPTLDSEETQLLAALMEEADAPPAPAPPESSGRAAQSEPPPASTPAPRTSLAAPGPLENARPLTMLSADANFRSAIDLVKQRRIPEAADWFRRALARQEAGRYAVQVLLACQDSTLENSFERAPERTLYFVSTTYRGQTCYKLFDGIYSTEGEARSEIDRLPPLFREGGNRPAVVRLPQH